MNMSRFSKILFFAAAAMAAVSCGSNARIEGELSDAPSSEVVVKLLNVNHYEVLDTVKTNASGKFSYKVDVKKGQPEFVYVFYKDTKVASLLLETGDKVSVAADTLGNYTVEGSEESLKLAQVEKEYADALLKLSDLSSKSMTAKGSELDEIKRQLGQEYINYYRGRVKYIMENSRSLTVVPVFFQSLKVNMGLSLVGVIAGEFLVSKAGLGYLIVYAGQVFKMDLVMMSVVLLGFIGGKMLYEGIKNRDCDCVCGCTSLTVGALLVQGIATSIDALSAGLNFVKYDLFGAIIAAIVIALVTFMICLCGVFLGKKTGTKLAGKAGILGGVILIAIGIEIFISSFI